MRLVDDQQVAMPAVLGEVEVGLGGDALVGGDVVLQPAAEVRSVLGGPDCDGMAEGAPPGRVGEGLLGLRRRLSRGTIQQIRSTTPASISRAAAITGSSDLPPPGVTAARMSARSVCPAAIAATMPATRCWCARRGRCIGPAASAEVEVTGQYPAEECGPA